MKTDWEVVCCIDAVVSSACTSADLRPNSNHAPGYLLVHFYTFLHTHMSTWFWVAKYEFSTIVRARPAFATRTNIADDDGFSLLMCKLGVGFLAMMMIIILLCKQSFKDHCTVHRISSENWECWCNKPSTYSLIKQYERLLFQTTNKK